MKLKSEMPKLWELEQGFTLIELVITVAIIGVLALVATPNFIDMRTDAKSAVTKERMQALKRSIVGDSRAAVGGVYTSPGFEADIGHPPASLAELTTQGAYSNYDPINRTGWRGPYIDTSAISIYSQDAWGSAFIFNTSLRKIVSPGPDKTSGNSDDITVTW